MLSASGCGTKAKAPGVVLQNGTTLRGQDAKDYCRGFTSPDERSRRACEAIGVEPPKTAAQRQADAYAADEAKADNFVAVARRLQPAVRAALGRRYRGVTGDESGIRIETTYPGNADIPARLKAPLCRIIVAAHMDLNSMIVGKDDEYLAYC
ncbi:MAG TPA: hypothetical protein VGM33_22860 [Baekduia sp.]